MENSGFLKLVTSSVYCILSVGIAVFSFILLLLSTLLKKGLTLQYRKLWKKHNSYLAYKGKDSDAITRLRIGNYGLSLIEKHTRRQ